MLYFVVYRYSYLRGYKINAGTWYLCYECVYMVHVVHAGLFCISYIFQNLTMIFHFVLHSPAIQENRVATVQCLSGTGSLRVGAEFLARHYHQVKFLLFSFFFYILSNCHLMHNYSWLACLSHYLVSQLSIYIPQPTWGNHPKVFTLAGLSVKTYRYYDPATRGLNFQGLSQVSTSHLFTYYLLLNVFTLCHWIL